MRFFVPQVGRVVGPPWHASLLLPEDANFFARKALMLILDCAIAAAISKRKEQGTGISRRELEAKGGFSVLYRLFGDGRSVDL